MSNNENETKKRKINILRFTIIILILLLLVAVGAGAGFLFSVFKNMPAYDPMDYNPDLTTFIYDNQGNLISQVRGIENRQWVEFSEIPETLKEAFLAIEDHRFYSHFGVDLEAIARSVLANIREGFGAQGASTITQQLARGAFIESREKILERKIQEAILAIQLERVYTKDEIFEFYLNHIYYGEGAWGLKAAAYSYFDKELDELTLAESAMLAGIVQLPNAHSPFRNPEGAMIRRNTVINQMIHHGYISEEEGEEAKAEEFTLNEDRKKLQETHPWFVDYVIKEASAVLEDIGIGSSQLFKSGFSVYTTMDTTMQIKLEEIYENPDNFPKSVDEVLPESAAVFLDHRTGEIKALVGGREVTTRRGLNRATDIKRQPGSTIKPIVPYAPALEMGYSPATILDDAPVEFPSIPEPYAPRNFDHRYRGLITMRDALKDSVNIAAVKMLNEIGVQNGFDFAKSLGLPLREDDRNLSLALGGLTSGVSPLDMATAFGAFPNQGVLVEPFAIIKILDRDGQILYEHSPNKSVVMSEQTAYLMTDMLTTVVESGTGTRAKLDRPAAGKTGTTQLPPLPQFANLTGSNFRDSWFVGYTPEYTGAVWMGYDETTPTHYLRGIFGGHLPALIWKQMMETGLKDTPVAQFARPSNLVNTNIDKKSGLLPSELTPEQYIISEIFTRDNVPREVSNAWVEKPICSETGLRPSDYCPDVVTGIFLERPIPFTPIESRPDAYPEDWELEYPKETCDEHDSTTLLSAVICEDPRHQGNYPLAIIPGEDMYGGCPPQYVREITIPANQIPTEYCTLPDHQLRETVNEKNNDQINTETRIELQLQLIKDDKGANAILLSWNSIGDDIQYRIKKWEDDGPQKQIGNFITGTTFLDEGVQSGKTYKYQIAVRNLESEIKTIIVD